MLNNSLFQWLLCSSANVQERRGVCCALIWYMISKQTLWLAVSVGTGRSLALRRLARPVLHSRNTSLRPCVPLVVLADNMHC